MNVPLNELRMRDAREKEQMEKQRKTWLPDEPFIDLSEDVVSIRIRRRRRPEKNLKKRGEMPQKRNEVASIFILFVSDE